MSRQKTERPSKNKLSSKHTYKAPRRIAEILPAENHPPEADNPLVQQSLERQKLREVKTKFENLSSSPRGIQKPDTIYDQDKLLTIFYQTIESLVKARQEYIQQQTKVLKSKRKEYEKLVIYQTSIVKIKEYDEKIDSETGKFVTRLDELHAFINSEEITSNHIETATSSLIKSIKRQLEQLSSLSFADKKQFEQYQKTLQDYTTEWLSLITESNLSYNEKKFDQLSEAIHLNAGQTTTFFIFSRNTDRQELDLILANSLTDQLFVDYEPVSTTTKQELIHHLLLIKSCQDTLANIPIATLHQRLDTINQFAQLSQKSLQRKQNCESSTQAVIKEVNQIRNYYRSYSDDYCQDLFLNIQNIESTIHKTNEELDSLQTKITQTKENFANSQNKQVDYTCPTANTKLIENLEELKKHLEEQQQLEAQLNLDIDQARKIIVILFERYNDINNEFLSDAYQQLSNALTALATIDRSIPQIDNLLPRKPSMNHAALTIKKPQIVDNAVNPNDKASFNHLIDTYQSVINNIFSENISLSTRKRQVESIQNSGHSIVNNIFSHHRKSLEKEQQRLLEVFPYDTRNFRNSIRQLDITFPNDKENAHLETLIQDYKSLRISIGRQRYSTAGKFTLLSKDTYKYSFKFARELEKLHRCYCQLNIQHDELDKVIVNKLPNWITKTQEYINSTEGQQIRTKEAFNQLMVAEAKVNCQTYQLSLRLIEELDEEIFRIMQKYIENNLTHENVDFHERYLSLYENLKKNTNDPLVKNQLYNQIPKDGKNEFVNTIDPRLSRLLDIKEGFQETNKQFIDNLYDMNESAFHQQLTSKVRDTLLNDHMEDLSDEKRSNFTQWMRRHIIKPLQNSTNWIARFQNRNNPNFFEATKCTKGACHTEYKLIEIGNVVAEQLQNKVSVAAAGA